MQVTDCDNALEHVRIFVRVGLVEHTLVAGAVGARLVGIDTRYYDNFILYLVLDCAQP